MRNVTLILLLAVIAAAQNRSGTRDSKFEGQDSVVLANDRLELTVLPLGSVIANIVMNDDAEKLNPLWNPLRLARDAGRSAPQFNGIFGHFVCVDGFGQPSMEERAAGFPQHGEAHGTHFTVNEDAAGNAVSLSATLPIVQEVFSRTFHMVNGESVIYVDSRLENLMGFDRPVNWAEHATVAAPFLEPGRTVVTLSGSRSQNRDYLSNQQAGRANQQAGRGGGGGRGNGPPTQRRLVAGKDFTWPMADGLDGKPVDLSAIPDDPHYIDHAATLLDPSRRLEWIAALNTDKKLLYGYVFRREDYPWLQHWGNYPSAGALVRGMEFSTQPYDVPRREAISVNSLFGTPTYRWLPAKGTIESHFVIFYARVPQGFGRVDEITLANGRIVIEDKKAGRRIDLAASRGL